MHLCTWCMGVDEKHSMHNSCLKKSLSCPLHSTLFILPLRFASTTTAVATDGSCSSSSLQTHKIRVPCVFVCVLCTVYWVPEACIQIVAQQNKHTHTKPQVHRINYHILYNTCGLAGSLLPIPYTFFGGVFQLGWTRFCWRRRRHSRKSCGSVSVWNLSRSVCLLILLFLYLEQYGIIQ